MVEVLGHAPLDCLCIDAEHAPFDRRDLDLAVLAARAADMPSLVRIAHQHPSEILNALDIGATGVIVPHVVSGMQADAIVAACRYGPQGRGYAGSTRAAGYGTDTMSKIMQRANAEVTVIAQIEDAEALTQLDAIAAVEGIDALFVGRMDLTVSLGAQSPHDPIVLDAVNAICEAAKRHGRSVGMFTQTTDEARQWQKAGASLFLLASEHQWMLQGARSLRREFEQ